MDAGLAFHAAQAVLAVHVTIAAFILFGLVAIPIGARLGWVFVYGFWWRLAHTVAMGAVAGQKLIGGACFLSVWEDRLLAMAGGSAARPAAIHSLAEQVMHVPSPMWVATVVYSLLFAYTAALWLYVRPLRRGGNPPSAAGGR